ncbi:LOW QUALITY PROTEIN: RNA exonuclease 5 [Molossus nigricans]
MARQALPQSVAPALPHWFPSSFTRWSESSWCRLSYPHLNSVVVHVLQPLSTTSQDWPLQAVSGTEEQLSSLEETCALHSPRASTSPYWTVHPLTLRALELKFHLPSPSSDFLADVTGLQKKQTAGVLPKTVAGSSPSASSNVSINLQNDPVVQKYGSKKVRLTRLLTEEEMQAFHSPLQGWCFPEYENFVSTKSDGVVTESLFGLDCEVCLTMRGRELTHISLVAEEGGCVMDELVKPDGKILDYLTSCSEITKKILNPVTTKVKDVQRQLKTLLPPTAVLVGYSSDLDLKALKMIRPYVIDTSLLYVREQGRRFKLKFLAKAILGVLECPESVGPKLLFLTREEDSELTSSRSCQTVTCLSNEEVICQAPASPRLWARVEMPPFPFSIVRFSFEPFPPTLTEEMNKRMRVKWTEISTVYAGPFSKNCNLRALKKLFKSFGPVRSMTLVLETRQPHSCAYEVLEPAQLAIESSEGIPVDDTCIERPVTELPLECDTVKKLDDSENRGPLFLSGVSKSFKEHLLQQSNLFFGLEAVILPKDPKSGKQKKHCFLKFKPSAAPRGPSAFSQAGLEAFSQAERQARRPQAPPHWLGSLPPEPGGPRTLRGPPPWSSRSCWWLSTGLPGTDTVVMRKVTVEKALRGLHKQKVEAERGQLRREPLSESSLPHPWSPTERRSLCKGEQRALWLSVHTAPILDSEGGPPKDSSLALGRKIGELDSSPNTGARAPSCARSREGGLRLSLCLQPGALLF